MFRLLLKACAVCLFVAVLGLAAPVSAAPHMNWQTTDFYFDGTGKPVVVGYFVNDGTDPVTVVSVRHHIYLKKGEGEFFLAAAAVWTGLDITLKPGERSVLCRLKIADYSGERYEYDRVRTKGDITFRLFRGIDV